MAGFGSTVRFARSAATGAALAAARTPARRLRELDFGPFVEALAAYDRTRALDLEQLIAGASVADLGALLDEGRLTAAELALHHLGRIRRLDGELHAIIELNPDALADADASDRRRAEGGSRGPLEGIPVTLKDNIETAGPMRTTGGAVVLADHVAPADAAVVASLREAGAVVLGKANLSELAGAVSRVAGVSAVGGQAVNPHGRAFSPGGSSSGSAIAVAAGLCVLSVGTETSGSLIAPAAFNGVVGMKPSRGVLSAEGIIGLVSFQDSAGPVAGSVGDAALLLAALGGPASPLPVDPLSGAVAGLLSADILAQPKGMEDPTDNPRLVESIRTALGAAGASVEEAVIDHEAMAGYENGFVRVVLGGLAHDTMDHLARAGAPASTLAGLADFNLAKPRVRMPRGQLLLGLALLWQADRAAYERAALDYRERATTILEAAFVAAGCDLLVSLSNVHSSLYATAGFPAVTVPLGVRANGMPTGATLIGRPGEDARLLGFARALEDALDVPRTAPARI